MTRSRAVPTPYGDGRLDVHAAHGTTVTLLLSHGAGNGVEARDLAALATALPAQGVTVALFEQPWRVAGGKVASPPPTLDVGLRAAARVLRAHPPLVVGGRSAGARSASVSVATSTSGASSAPRAERSGWSVIVSQVTGGTERSMRASTKSQHKGGVRDSP